MSFRQEMPPEGGYSPINYCRVPLKSPWPPLLKLGVLLGLTGVGWVGYHMTKTKILFERIELKCANIALMPMLYAERDRMMLKQLKRNRDAEERIMKDVEGWEVGKWKGRRPYVTLGPDEWFKPSASEYYAHAPEEEMLFAFNIMKIV